MSPIEQIFFLSLALFNAIGLIALCYKIDKLEKENESLKRGANKNLFKITWKP